MKTILVPIDFSRSSDNTIDYAVEISKLTKATLILFHVCAVPVIASEIPAVLSTEEIEKEAIRTLQQISKKIYLNHGFFPEFKCTFGFAVEEISRFAEENKIDLIVMGMESTGYLTELLVGNITTSLIKVSKSPVLAINEKIAFRNIKKIVLAWDYKKLQNKLILGPLKKIANLFRSHIYVLNIVQESEMVPSIRRSVSDFFDLEDSLKNIDHSLHYIKDEDIVESINSFVDDHQIDMVVMIPRMHPILQNIFHEPNTKRMAFHTEVPLLALHE